MKTYKREEEKNKQGYTHAPGDTIHGGQIEKHRKEKDTVEETLGFALCPLGNIELHFPYFPSMSHRDADLGAGNGATGTVVGHTNHLVTLLM